MLLIHKSEMKQYSLLIILIMLNRLVIPGFNSLSISFAILFFYLIVCLFNKSVVVNYKLLLKFLTLISVLSISIMIASFNSNYNMIYLGGGLVVLLYSIFIFDFKNKFPARIVLNSMYFFVILGLFQFLVYKISNFYLDLDLIFNKDFLIQGYNSYSGNNYLEKRINGIFFLEPSFFSQFCALYLILEYSSFNLKNKMKILTTLFVLLMTGSGTGIILLLFFIILNFLFKRNLKFFALTILCFFLAPVIFSLLLKFFSNFGLYVLERSNEFSLDGDTSFNYRFTLPYILSYSFVSNLDFLSIFFGNGPITTEEINNRFWKSEVNFSALIVSMFEYGLIFTVLYAKYLYSIAEKIIKNEIQLSILFMFLFLSGSFYQSYTVILLWIFFKLLNFNFFGNRA